MNMLNDNSNKHKVAFYVALVILLVTLRQCDSHSIEATEVISHSSQEIPKKFSTDVSVIRGFGDVKGISEKLKETREILRSLIFDWNLRESGIDQGRTFGRIRMMKNIFLPVAFLGGFLTAIILGIKAVGVINMFLISGLLALNFAFVIGKLIYIKKGESQSSTENHYHTHNNQYPSYGSQLPSYGPTYGSKLPWYGWNTDRNDLNLPYGRNMEQESNGYLPKYPATYTKYPDISDLQISQFPSMWNSLQPPQQDSMTTSNQHHLLSTIDDGMNVINRNSIQQQIPFSNFGEIKPVSSLSPLEMEKILTDALSRIGTVGRPTAALPSLSRHKRKLTNRHTYLNLLRPFS